METKNLKASPVGSLLKGTLINPMHLAKKKLQQPYDYHHLVKEMPIGYCPCVSNTEKKFAMENFDRIVRTREKETAKDKQRHVEANYDFGSKEVP